MASLRERGGRWLRGELPALVAAGILTEETARALERHYPDADPQRSRNFGLVLLAVIGSALVAAGIILLIAHNWDEFSRPLRSAIAFVPLISAQVLSLFRSPAARSIASVAGKRRHLQCGRHRHRRITR